MKSSNRQVFSTFYDSFYRLAADSAQTAAQFCVAYVFFIITLRRFSCDLKFSFFIVVCFKVLL